MTEQRTCCPSSEIGTTPGTAGRVLLTQHAATAKIYERDGQGKVVLLPICGDWLRTLRHLADPDEGRTIVAWIRVEFPEPGDLPFGGAS